MAGLELREVTRRFEGRVALDGVDLSVGSGDVMALIGPSGSGKSTLIRLLAGALQPTSGEVRADGVSLGDLSDSGLQEHRSRCALIEQGGNLVPQLSAHHNVLAGRLPRWSAARVLLSQLLTLEREPIRALLEEVGLGDRQWDRTADLSGGEQQRVAIARAMAGEPRWILADEPTASLDPATAHDMASLLTQIARAANATLVFSTHWMEFVSAHADRVVGLREGRVAFDLPAPEVTETTLDTLYEGSRERR